MRRALVLAALMALPLPAAARPQREIAAVAAAHKANAPLPAGTRFRRVEGQALAGLLAGRRWTFREGALRADFDVFRDGRLRVRFRDPARSGRADTPRSGRWWLEGREICLTLAAGIPDSSSCAVGYVSANTVLLGATRGGPEGKARQLLAILSDPRRLRAPNRTSRGRPAGPFGDLRRCRSSPMLPASTAVGALQTTKSPRPASAGRFC